MDEFATTADWLRARTAGKSFRTASRELGIDRVGLADYVDGVKIPPDDIVTRLAEGWGDDVETALHLAVRSRVALEAQRRGRHKPGLGPPEAADDLVDRLADAVVQRVMGAIGQQLAASLPEWAHAGSPPVATARLIELAGGSVKPMIVEDDRLLAQGLRAGSVAWIDASGQPGPGRVVRVADGRLKLYEDGDEVTGVVVLVQYSPP